MKISLRFFLGLWASSACLAQQPAWPIPNDLEAIHGIVIGKGGNRELHAEVIQLKNPSPKPRRGIIYVHGGGWSSGTNEYDVVRVFFLARAGYLVASIEYRLSGEAKWPAQLEDCKLGVRWLRANAFKFGIDPDRLGVYGISAGGHLVACLGTMHDPRLEGHGGYPGVSSRVQAVVDTAGPVDFVGDDFYAHSSYITESQKLKDDGMMEALLGTPFATNPEPYREASPIDHVASDTPPFFIANGEMDPIVSPFQAARFADRLRSAGVPVEQVLVKNAVHGLGRAPGAPPADPDTDAWHKLVLEFYAKYIGK